MRAPTVHQHMMTPWKIHKRHEKSSNFPRNKLTTRQSSNGVSSDLGLQQCLTEHHLALCTTEHSHVSALPPHPIHPDTSPRNGTCSSGQLYFPMVLRSHSLTVHQSQMIIPKQHNSLPCFQVTRWRPQISVIKTTVLHRYLGDNKPMICSGVITCLDKWEKIALDKWFFFL